MRTVLISLLLVAATGCGDGGTSGNSTKVAAAFYPLAFAAEQVGGPATEVTNLTPPGVEPHDIELSARDVERVGNADLVVYLGAGFQPALERAIETTGVEALDVLEGLSLRLEDSRHGHDDEPDNAAEGTLDPHVWLDPVRFGAVVERIAGKLGRQRHAEELVAKLERLDADFQAGLRDCDRRELVTSHAAFAYLADRYGLEHVAITGISPEAEPTPGELHDLVEKVRDHGATTVFFETLVSPRLAETVAREVGAETAVLNPLEGLTPPELDRGEDYFSVMRDNLAALERALGCR